MSKVVNQPMKKPTKKSKDKSMRKLINRRKNIQRRKLNVELYKQVENKNIELYAFRGNIILPNTSEQLKKINNSKNKNKIFRSFFEYLKEKKRIDVKYRKKIYYLSVINQYDTIIYCQLEREELDNEDENAVINNEPSNYCINIFIELKSQKLLIEAKENFFEKYSTCIGIIVNIMNKYLKKQDAVININSIAEEEEFWKVFSENNEVKSMKFDLTVPNLFDASDDATNFLNSAKENIGATGVSLTFSNPKENLKVLEEGIESYVKYSSAGGGEWQLKYKDEEKKSKTITSQQKIRKTSFEISRKKEIYVDESFIKNIEVEMQKLETIEKFKEESNEE